MDSQIDRWGWSLLLSEQMELRCRTQKSRSFRVSIFTLSAVCLICLYVSVCLYFSVLFSSSCTLFLQLMSVVRVIIFSSFLSFSFIPSYFSCSMSVYLFFMSLRPLQERTKAISLREGKFLLSRKEKLCRINKISLHTFQILVTDFAISVWISVCRRKAYTYFPDSPNFSSFSSLC